MAKRDVVMPQMGESITNGTITKWHKGVGDTVQIDEILLEISTDKVESEIPSPFEGRIDNLFFEEGDTVDVGTKIAEIEDDPSAAEEEGTPRVVATAVAPVQEAPKAVAPPRTSAGGQAPPAKRFYTPLVKAMAKERGISLDELSHIQGSGSGGRVNKKDLLRYAESRNGAAAKAPTRPVPPPSAEPTAPKEAAGNVEIVAMDNMRKTIARNMVASKMTSPHVNSLSEVDMTNLVKFRECIKEDFKREEGFSLTYTHFVLYALVQALKKYPTLNASVEGDNIIVKKDINLGCAVAVPGSGLVVPIIKGADGLNLTGIARTLNELVGKARAKKLTMDDLGGGTYTFTNNGSFGVLAATPIILQPQVGIFCIGAIKKRPVVTRDDAIGIAHIMYATHTYDHRIIDGELGSLFLMHVVRTLETMDPGTLF